MPSYRLKHWRMDGDRRDAPGTVVDLSEEEGESLVRGKLAERVSVASEAEPSPPAADTAEHKAEEAAASAPADEPPRVEDLSRRGRGRGR